MSGLIDCGIWNLVVQIEIVEVWFFHVFWKGLNGKQEFGKPLKTEIYKRWKLEIGRNTFFLMNCEFDIFFDADKRNLKDKEVEFELITRKKRKKNNNK